MKQLQNQNSEQQNWRQLASVQVGGAICLPLLLVGYELAKTGSLQTQLFSLMWGNGILFIFALVAGSMSANRNLTTVEYASLYFGAKAKVFFALTLSLSMLGWFAIQTQCMGKDVDLLIQHLNLTKNEPLHLHAETQLPLISFFLSFGMIAGAFWGLKFLTSLSNACIPLLIATIGYAVIQVGFLSLSEPSFLPFQLWDGKSVSLVLASSIAGTIDLPTFYRHAKSKKASTVASIANYLIAMPLVQMAGMWLYYGTKEASISQALATSASFSWKIWVAVFMLLAGWTTNNVNLYSAALSIKSLSKKLSFSKAMVFTGIGAGCLVFIPLLDQFALALDLMGIFVASMGLVMFMAYLLEIWKIPAKPFSIWTAWFLGIGAGLITLFWPQWGGTGAPVLNAALAAGTGLPFVQLLMYKIFNNFKYSKHLHTLHSFNSFTPKEEKIT